jgi:hypothetical protein
MFLEIEPLHQVMDEEDFPRLFFGWRTFEDHRDIDIAPSRTKIIQCRATVQDAGTKSCPEDGPDSRKPPVYDA